MRTILSVFVVAVVLAATSAFAQGPFLAFTSATITSGQSLSAAVDLKDMPILAIVIPSAWTTADLTFQASADGTTYYDVYNLLGTEHTVVAAASRYIAFMPLEFQWARYIKIRSGTSGTPVAQGGTRTIIIVKRQVL
jgi:hypothetical protein